MRYLVAHEVELIFGDILADSLERNMHELLDSLGGQHVLVLRIERILVAKPLVPWRRRRKKKESLSSIYSASGRGLGQGSGSYS